MKPIHKPGIEPDFGDMSTDGHGPPDLLDDDSPPDVEARELGNLA